MKSPRKESSTLKATEFRNTFQALVRSILGVKKTPKVSSRGTSFYNKDNWAVRALADKVCQHTKGGAPDKMDILDWIRAIDKDRLPAHQREIVIAAIPEKLSRRDMLALAGGAYHEAWHSHYDKTDNVDLEEVADIILPRWYAGCDWQLYGPALLEWTNVIMDIRIERLGVKEFPGTRTKLADLQDYILLKEEGSRKEASAGGFSPYSVILCTFRDLGLGYVTHHSKRMLARYKKYHPEAVEMVTRGPLRPLLDQAVALGCHEDLLPLGIAMDVIAVLDSISNPSIKEQARRQQAHEQSPNEEPGRAGEAPLPFQASMGGEEGGEDESKPSNGQHGAPKKGEGGGRDAGETAEGGAGAPSGDVQSGDPNEGSDPSVGAGRPYKVGEKEGNQFFIRLLGQLRGQESAGLFDFNKALEHAIKGLIFEENLTLETGEQIWRPFDPGAYTTKVVTPSEEGLTADKKRALDLARDVRKQTSYLTSRLRTIVRAAEMVSHTHGVPRGKDLSERYLVDTYLALRGKEAPRRAYYRKATTLDTSMAAVLVLDQSSSMRGILKDATKVLISLAEPLDSIGCAVEAVGFRDGVGQGIEYPENSEDYHRFQGVHYDVYKHFDEPFSQVRWRFANTVSQGGTPMSDGIQYALDALDSRSEGYRSIFVVTDGAPNFGDEKVVRHQVRIAQDAGIHIIGVGFGTPCKYIKHLFEDHVWTLEITELPKALVRKLNKLYDPRVLNKRGTRIWRQKTKI